MKRLLRNLSIMALMLVGFLMPTKADIITVGTGTSTSEFPFYTWYMDASSYFLYKNTEITAVGGGTGTIKSLAFNFSSLNASYQAMNGFKIYFQNSTLTTLTGPVTTGWTLVYSVPAYTPTVLGWYTFTLQTPFDYDASKNLLMKICFNNTSYTGWNYVYATSVASTTWCGYSDLSADDGCTYNFTWGSVPARPNARLDIEMNPKLVNIYPAEGTILTAGAVVPFSSNNHPAVDVKRSPTQPAVTVSYKVTGPSSNPTTIYEATLEGNNNILDVPLPYSGDPFNYKFTHARGNGARIDPDNTGEFDFSRPGIPGGQYTIETIFKINGFPELTSTKTQKFIIALPWDLTVGGIVSPVVKTQRKYPLAGPSGIPLRVNVMNVGTQPVDSFKVEVKVYNSSNQLVNGQTRVWIDHNNPLTTGAVAPITFTDYRPSTIGDYRVEAFVTLYTNQDLDNSNDMYPQTGAVQHIFQVAHGTDAVANAVLVPTGNIYIGRPIVPLGKFLNNGVEDLSEIPATLTIKNPAGNTVYEKQITIESIPFSGNASTVETFWQAFVPETLGVHTVILNINPVGDGYPGDNTLTTTFNVIAAMSGTYTVGTLNNGASNNFTTITSAVQALYERGVTGPVEFHLTDAVYNEGDIFSANPAIDLRSKIIGVSAANTIKFRPAPAKSVLRSGITINLSSAAGIGFLFGQTPVHNYTIAPINSVTSAALKRIYSNSEGYITFDGGSQKTFMFKVVAPAGTNFRAPFYLAGGSKNINIMNCLMDGVGTTTSLAYSLPLVNFDAAQQRFNYQADVRGTATYSAGVVIRNQPPVDLKTGTNAFNLDTIINSNNKIHNNEITNFGYGIVSLGNGALINPSSNTLERYYNKNNAFTNNMIYGVGRAGIFVGFEENSEIKYNKVFNISTTAPEVAGIIAGGEALGTALGYNNVGVKIEANEISNINSPTMVYGVKVEQYQATIQAATGTKTFPDVAESMTIASNSIWGINAVQPTAHRVGIYLATDRDVTIPWYDARMITPKSKAQFSNNDKIVNNTIVIPGDGGLAHTGNIAGISLMQIKNALVKNNAIAVLDQEAAPAVETIANIFYNGVKPSSMDNKFDRNAFWNNNPNGALYRFVETEDDNDILEAGFVNEFNTLEQWKFWTNSDINSVVYNFINDLEYVGSNPQRLRAKSNPTPIGSMINNRGENIEGIQIDIDGNPRGVANQRYDIGAYEFNGRIYTSDLEVVSISAPGAYTDLRAASNFKDAEYIMTQAPIEVKAIIRNNGSIIQTDKDIKVEIFKEDPNGTFPTSPVLTKTVKATISSTDDVTVAFGLADGLNNDDFIPTSYHQLQGLGYTPAAHFKTMLPNVTPRYRIRVSVPTDEVPVNNVNLVDKVVRFYLKRSGLNIILSLENSHLTITGNAAPTAVELDNFAGKLNADSLVRAFSDIGWYQVKGEAQHDIDLFERKGWEPRSVNYPLYRSLLWSDAADKQLTRYEIKDLNKFITAGTTSDKKNLIMSSQEAARQNGTALYPDGILFTNNVLRAIPAAERAFPAPKDQIKGVAIARNLISDIIPTGFTGDANPLGEILNINNNGIGLSRIGFFYLEPAALNMNSKIMSIATSTITTNVLYFAHDWRHFADPESIIRASMDYIENNGGTIIPIELLSFDADAVGNRVELSWTTASEDGAARFDIERASVDNSVVGSFAKIDEMKAAGNSNIAVEYGPVIDRNVAAGNTYAYRLRMVDLNGEVSYSNERIVSLTNIETVSVNEIVPNPAVSNVILSINIGTANNARIELFDMSGRRVMQEYFGSLVSGTNEVALNVSNLSSGSYRLVVTSGTTSAESTLNIVK